MELVIVFNHSLCVGTRQGACPRK